MSDETGDILEGLKNQATDIQMRANPNTTGAWELANALACLISVIQHERTLQKQ